MAALRPSISLRPNLRVIHSTRFQSYRHAALKKGSVDASSPAQKTFDLST
jgi:hypothetical protein